MKLDIRLPMGYLFMLLGGLLLAYGLGTGAPTQGVAAGLNVNAGWGAVLAVFGLAMWLLARRSGKQRVGDDRP